jgi:hypothetical protein
VSGPIAPLASLLAAVLEAKPGSSLASVLLGEAVLGQRTLEINARIRSLVAEVLLDRLPEGTVCAVDGTQGLALLVPGTATETALDLTAAVREIVVIHTPSGDLRVTPASAVTTLTLAGATVGDASDAVAACRRVAMHALELGDLRVVISDSDVHEDMERRGHARSSRSDDFARERAREEQRHRLAQATLEADDERQLPESAVRRRPLGARQIAATYLLTLLLPFAAYVGLAGLGLNALPLAYPIVVVALLVTAAMILVEALKALSPTVVPLLTSPEPAASALVAAYLPNEQHTVMETVLNLLAQDYPGGLQVVLAYNTPAPVPVEAELERLARMEPRFTALRVEHSTSKAANVNAALQFCTGEFIGIFDADHLPAPGSFSRAWRWLQPSVGNDVVQGHCVVRDAERGRLARTVAMEFETIYAVSHPGRARMHGFGVFGGLLLAGGKVVSDPGLVSTELAPASMRSLWTQRMRWAQGWHQVSRRHLLSLLTNEHFTLRQKAGAAWLFGWREIYPWISLQSLPILAAAVVLAGPNHKSWVLPLFVATTVFTVLNGPLQVLLAWRVAVPELRVRKRWWLVYLLMAVPYSEMKNLIGRVAQVKEMLGERHWQVTARPAAAVRPVVVGAR